MVHLLRRNIIPQTTGVQRKPFSNQFFSDSGDKKLTSTAGERRLSRLGR